MFSPNSYFPPGERFTIYPGSVVLLLQFTISPGSVVLLLHPSWNFSQMHSPLGLQPASLLEDWWLKVYRTVLHIAQGTVASKLPKDSLRHHGNWTWDHFVPPWETSNKYIYHRVDLHISIHFRCQNFTKFITKNQGNGINVERFVVIFGRLQNKKGTPWKKLLVKNTNFLGFLEYFSKKGLFNVNERQSFYWPV